MNEPTHLFEADKHRIANEAKIRTALEQPDFAQREFEKWQASRERGLELEKREYFVNAWSKVAWLAEGRMAAMGRELNKLQQRIGRQRKANKEANERIHHLEEKVVELEKALEFYADERNYTRNTTTVGSRWIIGKPVISDGGSKAWTVLFGQSSASEAKEDTGE